MKGISMSLKELMETETYKEAKNLRYVDIDRNEVITKNPILVAPVVYFGEENGTLVIQLWIVNNMPNGWKTIAGAMTAPNGFCWINNGKSVFDENYKKALLKTK